MTQANHKWSEMCRALESFRKANGHANVPANWRQNPSLGRWVAMQRYRRKVGELAKKQVEELERYGFVWSPTDMTWNRMFDKLAAFKRKYGHCNVPSQWREDRHLSNWVANQRHRRKMGLLSPDRAKRLDSIGFSWALYGKGLAAQASAAPRGKSPAGAAEGAGAVVESPERLYHAAAGVYVQYNGRGALPQGLERYMSRNRGQYPSYIPLPHGPVRFLLPSDGDRTVRKLLWSGKGPVPADVLEFVNENGALPTHDP